jgi:hypothetical protein
VYDGTYNAKVLGHFCWDNKQYLEKMNGSLDNAKVNVVAMFFMGTVKVWCRNRVKDLAFGCTVDNIKN